METLLQANPDVTAVYAHNDEMAIGAIAALEAAGRVPGQDVTLVSIDGSNAALDAIVEGKLGASVESSPFFGPISMETMMKYVNGEDIPDWCSSRTASSTRRTPRSSRASSTRSEIRDHR
jgi:ribose transport system substrate-binding protein